MARLRSWTIGLLALAVACGRSTSPGGGAPSPALEAGATGATAGAAVGRGRVLEGRFFAASLGVEKRYRAWLPAGHDADPARRWPVVYMLHGLGGDQDNWLEHGKLDAAAD